MEDNILVLVLARAAGTRRGRRPGHAHTHHVRESGEPGCIGHGAIHSGGAVQHRSRWEGSDHTPTMDALRQSDHRIVPVKFPNNPATTGAEGMEGRRWRKGNVVAHLPYAGRRAGRTCAARGATDGAYGAAMTRARSRMRETRTSGSARGAACEGRPYRDPLSATSTEDRAIHV
jgi:hypothetical protein